MIIREDSCGRRSTTLQNFSRQLNSPEVPLQARRGNIPPGYGYLGSRRVAGGKRCRPVDRTSACDAEECPWSAARPEVVPLRKTGCRKSRWRLRSRCMKDNWLGGNDSFAFLHSDELVRLDCGDRVLFPARPHNLEAHSFALLRFAQAERQWQLALG